MTRLIDRTCTEIDGPNSVGGQHRPLKDFQDLEAYVLLGAAGAGKTTEFRRFGGESYVSARDFLCLDIDRNAQGRHQTIFIDGLDEVRAGSSDARTPLDRIRTKLQQLGCPRFRLSCRVADWLGCNDRGHLREVSPNGEVKVLLLDKLSKDDVREILSKHAHIVDTDGFFEWASRSGIESLLANPQSLNMLVKAFEVGERPDSRLQVFDAACKALLKEHNQEHKIASPLEAGVLELLDIAGNLCALLLLSGKAGFTLPPADADEDDLDLEEHMTCQQRRLTRHLMGTKLFDCPDESRCTPIHRQVAEFLGARYLAERVTNGLPVKRVLALMTGHDGGVVSELRGLSAWLAAHCQVVRAEIIERDPLGTILYGDVRGFSVENKRQILVGLERETTRNPWIAPPEHMDTRLGDFVTPNAAALITDVLTGRNRDTAKQSLVSIVVEMLAHGQPVDGMSERLYEMLRDTSRWSRIKASALRAYLHQETQEGRAVARLKALLGEVLDRQIPDPEDDLLGNLLMELFPKAMSAREVVQCLKPPERGQYLGMYKYFWNYHVCEQSSRSEVVGLLRELLALDKRQNAAQESWRWLDHWQRTFQILLRRLLEESEDVKNPALLYDFLEIAMRAPRGNRTPSGSTDEQAPIRSWLKKHPDIQVALFEVGFSRCLDSFKGEKESFQSFEENIQIFHGFDPSEFPRWCLEKLIVTDDPKAQKWLLERVARLNLSERHAESLPVDVVESRMKEVPQLLNAFREKRHRQLIEKREWARIEDETSQQESEWEDERRRRRHVWRDRVKAHEEALRSNTADAGFLGQLATAYLGGYSDVSGNTPHERLRALLGEETHLIEAVQAGLRGSLWRTDLSKIAEVIRLGTEDRVHHLSLAFWAGMEEVHRSYASGDVSLNLAQTRLALAIHYNVAIWSRSWDHPDKPPAWILSILRRHPNTATNVLVRTARARFRAGDDYSATLHALVDSSDYTPIAKLASLKLLRSFPLRCRRRQLPSLNYLLQAALQHCDRQSLVGLIEQKARQPNMDLAQQVYWLTAALFVSPDTYASRFDHFFTGNERRVQHLAELVLGRLNKIIAHIPRSNEAVLALLIKHLGRIYPPYSLDSDSEETIGAVMPIDVLGINNLLSNLASIATAAASQAIDELVNDEHLQLWRSRLINAAYLQRINRREAEFRHADANRIIDVLDNRAPANAADLAALATNKLSEIAKITRDGNASGWRQFWNVDSHNRAQTPRPEDACRDALLSGLKLLVEPFGVDAQPEGRYADDKRADMRLSIGDINIPVEIKRSCHRQLWSAVKTQLIAKYTRDPGAEGYGIYLVLWFGNIAHCRPTPNDQPPPKNAQELEKRLLETLSNDERAKISVLVVDVSQEDDESAV